MAAAAAAAGGAALAVSTGLETATLQKLALRRKKVLGAEEMELYELAQAAGAAIDPDVFKILVDLLNLNVAPLAVFQMLKSMCAGQRLASDPQDSVPISLSTSTSETRGATFRLRRLRRRIGDGLQDEMRTTWKKPRWPHSWQCDHIGRTWKP
uniref:Mitotic spindle organizing protein 2 n=1 Tax=Mus musculus TaxID=10090 RepID=A0A2R8VKN7_MOUSE